MKPPWTSVAPFVVAMSLMTTAAMTMGCQMSTPPIGIDLRSETRFEYEWRRYLDLAAFKSIAVAGDPASTHVVGVAYAYPFSSMAVNAALSYCEERREDRGIEAPCETYAIGDERVTSEDDAS
jgi:hypothetical protein